MLQKSIQGLVTVTVLSRSVAHSSWTSRHKAYQPQSRACFVFSADYCASRGIHLIGQEGRSGMSPSRCSGDDLIKVCFWIQWERTPRLWSAKTHARSKTQPSALGLTKTLEMLLCTPHQSKPNYFRQVRSLDQSPQTTGVLL